MYIKLSPFRSSPPEVFFNEDEPQTWSKPTGEHQHRSAISTKPLCNFIKIKTMHRYAPENPQNTLLQENISGGLLLHVKRILKDLNYEKFLFTVVKRNILALKMDKCTNEIITITIIIIIMIIIIIIIIKNKYPVIVSKSPRKALRFFHWVLLL